MSSNASVLPQGTFMVGAFIKRETVVKDGKTGKFERVQVKLLIDDQFPRTVEYPADRVPAFIDTAERGDILTVPVFAKGYKDRVYWQGVTD